MADIFVYGTLMFPEIVLNLTGKSFRTKDALLKGFKRFKVFDENIPRRYPTLSDSQDSSVEGKILFNVDEGSLKILDFFEGEYYKRQKLRVILDGKELSVYSYLWNLKFKEKLKGEWNPEEFKESDLKYYLDTEIPEVLKEYSHKK